MSRVELRGIAKHFGPVQAVRDVSLDIPDGAFVTLLGPSGCGKTTTLNMIAGLEKVSRGAIYLDGQAITEWAPHERGMAIYGMTYPTGDPARVLRTYVAEKPRWPYDPVLATVHDFNCTQDDGSRDTAEPYRPFFTPPPEPKKPSLSCVTPLLL